MTDTRYLVHGVFWDGPPAVCGTSDGGSPVLRLQHLSPGHGFSEVRLDAGAQLGVRVADSGKHCLGHTKVFSEAEREHVPCPDRFPAARGSQCERCFVVDDSRLIHDFHRGGRVPPNGAKIRSASRMGAPAARIPRKGRGEAVPAGRQ